MRQQQDVLIRDHCSSMERAELVQVVLKQRRHFELQEEKQRKLQDLTKEKNPNGDNMTTCLNE